MMWYLMDLGNLLGNYCLYLIHAWDVCVVLKNYYIKESNRQQNTFVIKKFRLLLASELIFEKWYLTITERKNCLKELKKKFYVLLKSKWLAVCVCDKLPVFEE